MQGRGLKHGSKMPELEHIQVAPHAGAWIETFIAQKADEVNNVAPHAGAWIETIGLSNKRYANIVAPHAGAWIETNLTSKMRKSNRGRPSCRGVD